MTSDITGALWQVGDVVAGRYRVVGIHEHGGMGLVYRVRHLGWDTDLAVKCPRPRLFATAADRERFVAEAEAWVSLGLHPNICACHYVRVLGGIPRVFAEYVEGGSLRDWIADRRLYAGSKPQVTARILDLAIQTAWGLHYAHEHGLVHQDVKPANILIAVGPDGGLTAKVTDFGLARARAAATPAFGAHAMAAPPGVSVPVPAGGFTPAYASPEQYEGRALGRRTDVFSFAASVLEMFTGGVAWMVGPAAGEALTAAYANGPRADGLPALPSSLAGLLALCLRQDPSGRPASLAQVAAELVRVYWDVTGDRYSRDVPRAADLRADELNNRALSLLDLGRAAEAEQGFTAAHAADPQHVAAVYNLGLLRWRRGAVTDEELVAALESAAGDTGEDWTARLALAQVHLERGDFGAARGLLDGIEHEQPGRDGVAEALAVIDSGRFREAKAVERRDIPWYWTKPVQRPPFLLARLTESLDRVLIGNVDDSVRLYDIPSGQCLLTIGGQAYDLDMTPDGAFAVVCGTSPGVQLWDLATGTRLCTVGADERDQWPTSARLSMGNPTVAVAYRSGDVKVFDLRTGRLRWTIGEGGRGYGYGGYRTRVALSQDGRLALTSGMRDDAAPQVWDVETGRAVLDMEHSDQIQCAMSFSPDGRLAALSGDKTPTIEVWDLTTGSRLRTLKGQAQVGTPMRFSADNRLLVSCGRHEFRVWDVASGRCLRTFRGHTGNVTEVRFDATATHVMSVSDDNTARRWVPPGIYTAPPQLSRPREHAELTRLRATADRLVTEAEVAIAGERYPAALELLSQARALPGYERAPAVTTAWRSLGRWTVRSGLRAVWPVRTVSGHDYAVKAVAISADGRLAASGGYDRTVRLWDLTSGRCVRVIEDLPTAIVSVGLSADGKRVLALCSTRELGQWSVRTGERLDPMAGGGPDSLIPGLGVDAAHFTPDGRRALVGTRSTVRLWDVAANRGLRDMTGHLLNVTSVFVSADGRKAMSASHEREVRVWDTTDGQCLVLDHSGRVRTVCLSADGCFALSGEGYPEGHIRLWDVATGACLTVFDQVPSPAQVLRFTTDGRSALSGHADGSLRIWDLTAGRCVRAIEGHGNEVHDLALTPDGRFVLAGHGDGTMQVWETDWNLEAREVADWDEGVAPYVAMFSARPPAERTAGAVEELFLLLQHAGYGWVRTSEVRARLARRPGR